MPQAIFPSAPKLASGSDRLLPSFSKVVQDSQQAVSIRYNNEVYELKRKGIPVIVMSLGEAYFDIPFLGFEDLPFPDVYHYSHSRGIPELRENLSCYFKEEYEFAFDPDSEIIVTAGSKAAIHMSLMSILDPGDEVLIPEPAWVSYSEQVKLCYGQPVGMPVDKTVFDIEQYITDRTKAIIITTPHNPRGYVYSEAELAFLLELASRKGIWLLSDEAYSDFVCDGSFVSLGKLDHDKQRAIVFNSISKNYGISGWRLGYVIAHRDLIAQILKVNQHLITCPATILQYYVAKHFAEILDITRPQIAELLNRRDQVSRYLDQIGLARLPGNATFYFFVSIAPSRLTSEEFCSRLLHEEHVSVVPGSGYGASCDQYVRVSFGTATMEENFLGLRKIKQLIERTSR